MQAERTGGFISGSLEGHAKSLCCYQTEGTSERLKVGLGTLRLLFKKRLTDVWKMAPGSWDASRGYFRLPAERQRDAQMGVVAMRMERTGQ